MKTKPFLCVAIFCLGSLWLFVAQIALSQSATGNALLLSDIHFDPLADRKIVSGLIEKDVSQWKAALDSSEFFKQGIYPKPGGEDTNYVLLNSAILAVVDQKPFDFAIVTGDLLRHTFPSEFKKAGLPESDFRNFATKTAIFVVETLQSALGVPVYVALGNDDSDGENYKMDPRGPFLEALAPHLHVLEDAPEAAANFRAGGSTNFAIRRFLMLKSLFSTQCFGPRVSRIAKKAETASEQPRWNGSARSCRKRKNQLRR